MAYDLAGFPAAADTRKPAIIMGETGERLTFAELEAASSQAGRLYDTLGLEAGDRVAICLPNCSEFLVAACGALRVGLVVVPISSKLTAAEIEYIVDDAGAKILLTSPAIGPTHADLPGRLPAGSLFSTGGPSPGFEPWDTARRGQSSASLPPREEGHELLYSSGTTGRPKGVSRAGSMPPGGLSRRTASLGATLGFDASMTYLCPAPLYHAAPFGWSIAVLRHGGTLVVMERFDPEQALRLIERYRITASQWVPTHFSRMLKLPAAVRSRYDLSSMRLALHAAAPCPQAVKREMIAWWGPVIIEYYGSSEQSSLTMIDSADWLAHPGSVGRCLSARLHICDEDGEELPPGTPGLIYCEGGVEFSYRNEPEKTAQSRHAKGWTTVGDIGYLDEEGYLYLTDRKNFMIISGGVNVYPQEIEDLLITHPRIADAAVIGTPHDDLGEQVTAVIQTVDPREATPELAAELRLWMREHLSGVKVPRRIEFRSELPRLPTGKMVKHLLRDEYASPPHHRDTA